MRSMPVDAPPTTSGASSYSSGSSIERRSRTPSEITTRDLRRPGRVSFAREFDERRERLDVDAFERPAAVSVPAV